MQPASDKAMGGSSGRFTLRLMATSDLHAQIMPYCYAADRPQPTVGLARTAALIRAARAEADNALLFDNGDFLEGAMLGEQPRLGGHGPQADRHPMIAAMNHVGYDAATIGNHDFSHGVPFLEQALAGAAFPVVSANCARALGRGPLDDQPFLPPVALLHRTLHSRDGRQAAIAVGVIGFLPPQVTRWEGRALGGRIAARDLLETARHWVPQLKSMGADLIVALCHSGLGDGKDHPGQENAALALSALDGIDAIVAGHTHRLFPGPEAAPPLPGADPVRGSLCGKPAVMPGFWGSHLGLIDLALDRTAAGWRVAGFATALRPIAAQGPRGGIRPLVATDPGLGTLVRASHRAALKAIRRPVGPSARPLHSHFARIEPSAALDLVHRAQLSWLDGVADGLGLGHLPRLSAASPMKCGGLGGPAHFTDVPAGRIALRHIADLYAFPNTAAAVLATGAMLRDWLERAAAQFARLVPGHTDQPLFDPDMPAYNFDTIAGLSYAIDPMAAPRFAADGTPVAGAAGRIRHLAFRGRPLDDGARFLVATNNFRAAGGGNFAGLGPAATVLDSADSLRDILCVHVAAGGAARSAPPPRFWRLLRLPPGTGAWFDAGPAAAAHLPGLAAGPVTPLGLTGDGFLRCRLGG